MWKTAMAGYFASNHLPGIDKQRLGFCNPRGSDLISQRTHGAKYALEGGATHILWLDSDMLGPPDVLHRLFAHRKDIVTGNYAGKAKEQRVVASSAQFPAVDGSDSVFSYGKTGLEQIPGQPRTGLGCALVKADVFYRIEFPWFGHVWQWMGDGAPRTRVKDVKSFQWNNWKSAFEDWFFFKRCEDAKIPVYVDHDVSNELGHKGGCTYRHGGWDNCEPGR
jgi:hypothetical protein